MWQRIVTLAPLGFIVGAVGVMIGLNMTLFGSVAIVSYIIMRTNR